jgi:hypothetical protein
MMTFWQNIGVIRFPMAFAMLWIVGLCLYSAGQLFRPGARASLRNRAWLDGILFWGAFTAVTGVLGSLVGIIVAFQSVEQAGFVSPTLIAGGAKVALLSSALGFLVLGAASIGWYFMYMRWRILQARGVE